MTKATFLWILAAILLASCTAAPTDQTDDTPISSLEQDETAETIDLPDPDFTVRAGEFTAYNLSQGSYEYRLGSDLWTDAMGAEQTDGIDYTLRLSDEDGTRLTIAFTSMPDGERTSWPVFDYSPGVNGVTFTVATVVTEDGTATYSSNEREGLQGQVVLTRGGNVFSGEFDFTITRVEEVAPGFATEARFTGTFENMPLVAED